MKDFSSALTLLFRKSLSRKVHRKDLVHCEIEGKKFLMHSAKKSSKASSASGKKSASRKRALKGVLKPTDRRLANIPKHLASFHKTMVKHSEDVIDREICLKLRQLIETLENDISVPFASRMKQGKLAESEVSLLPESLIPFYRHYQFMLRRGQAAR